LRQYGVVVVVINWTYIRCESGNGILIIYCQQSTSLYSLLITMMTENENIAQMSFLSCFYFICEMFYCSVVVFILTVLFSSGVPAFRCPILTSDHP